MVIQAFRVGPALLFCEIPNQEILLIPGEQVFFLRWMHCQREDTQNFHNRSWVSKVASVLKEYIYW